MTTQPPRIAIGYTRVSTAQQADHGHSLAAQSESIRGFCDKHSLDLAHIYTDAGRFGS